MITIRLFDTIEKARGFKGSLEKAGVSVQLDFDEGDETRGATPLNFQIRVGASDMQRVREILEREHVGTQTPEHTPECPYCGSHQVEPTVPLHQRTIRFMVRLLVSKARRHSGYLRCLNCSQYWEVRSEKLLRSDSAIRDLKLLRPA